MTAVGSLIALRILLALCLAAYAVYATLTVRATWLWRRARRPWNPDWTPNVTILKPVRGMDAEAWENFASFCRLDYPTDRVQLLFGALDSHDPALDLVRRLQAEFPQCDIGLVCPPPDPPPSHNLKVANLRQMLPHAKYDLLVLCDSDMRVAPNYLRRVVAPFEKEIRKSGNQEISQFPNSPISYPPEVGLVTCPYRGHRAQSLAARLEALGIGADFIPSVLVSRMLEGVSFAFGSTIALPRAVLEQMGGFEAIADELADDYRLGSGAKQAGYEVMLSDYVVDDVLGKERFGAMWARRLRWARTVRACRPGGYAGAFITHGTALALLFLAAMGFTLPGWIGMGSLLAVRGSTALLVAHGTEDPNIARDLPLLPLSDLLSFALYIASYCGNTIVWRGERFHLLRGGRLVRKPVEASREQPGKNPVV